MAKVIFQHSDDELIRAEGLYTVNRNSFGVLIYDDAVNVAEKKIAFWLFAKQDLTVIQTVFGATLTKMWNEVEQNSWTKKIRPASKIEVNGGVCYLSDGDLIFQEKVPSLIDCFGNSPGADFCLQTIRGIIIGLNERGQINVLKGISELPQEHLAVVKMQLTLLRRFYTPTFVLEDVFRQINDIKALFVSPLAEELFPASLFIEMEEENQKKEATITEEKEPENHE